MKRAGPWKMNGSQLWYHMFSRTMVVEGWSTQYRAVPEKHQKLAFIRLLNIDLTTGFPLPILCPHVDKMNKLMSCQLRVYGRDDHRQYSTARWNGTHDFSSRSEIGPYIASLASGTNLTDCRCCVHWRKESNHVATATTVIIYQCYWLI